jgi:K+-sensing histidine kinase KdpD
MEQIIIPTKFAPAERAPLDKILHQKNLIDNEKFIKRIFETVPNIVMILNEQRQTIYCNQALLDLLGYKDDIMVFGFRPGEVLNCIHSDESEGGCGTSEFCSTCGAVKAILNIASGLEDQQECRITVKNKDTIESLDILVSAHPLKLENEDFTIFYIMDIGDEKRRKVLERIFFHDVLNTAGNIIGFLDLLKNSKDSSKTSEYVKYLDISSKILLDEIRSQRELLDAENDELIITIQPIQSLELLKEIAEIFSEHFGPDKGRIKIDPSSVNITFNSDPALLGRVLSNMIRNALEPTRSNEIVTLGCRSAEYHIEFWVNNPAVIPKDVQLQIFQRSFSTKGANRGIGTYSMKLLTEKYLKGSIRFESNEEFGTTFFARYILERNL